MPINPNIPEAFIAAYSHYYPQAPSSFLLSTSYALIGKLSPEAKAESCKQIIELFQPNLNAKDWIEITYTLGEIACVHQIDKNINKLQPGQSHLSQAIHAARSYIVASLAEDPQYQPTYQQTLAVLNAELAEKVELIAQNRRSTKMDVTKLCEDRKMLLEKLAYLGDEKALNACIDYGYFNYMPRLNDKPVNSPYCMKQNYFISFYEEILHDKSRENLDAFVQQARDRTLPFPLTRHEKRTSPSFNLVLTLTPSASEPEPESAAPDTQAAPILEEQPTTPAPQAKATSREASAEKTTDLSRSRSTSTETLITDLSPSLSQVPSPSVSPAPSLSPAPSVTSSVCTFPAAQPKTQPDPVFVPPITRTQRKGKK